MVQQEAAYQVAVVQQEAAHQVVVQAVVVDIKSNI